MPFQFMCPQGHLLEGHESQMGQQVQCPLCGTLLIIPIVGPQPAAAPAPPEYLQPPMSGGWPPQHPGAPAAYQPSPPPQYAAPEPRPVIDQFPGVQEPAAAPEPVPEEPQTVRILCPNGHELHTPMNMIGMQAACPECNAEFLLRYEDSIEYIEKKKAARLARDEAFNKAALKYSIIAAVVVVLALIGMMIVASMR